jgi:nitrate reductase gamma subunit
MTEESNWKARTIIIGVIAGALTGLGAALVLIQRAEQEGEAVQLGTSDGLKVGIGVLGLLRLIGQIGPRGD